MANELSLESYLLLTPPESSIRMGWWATRVGRYSEVIGYSCLGSFFLRDAARKEYLVLHPLLSGNNAKAYGFFESSGHFENDVLKDPQFVERFLRPGDLRLLRSLLGDLAARQIYYPVPFPCLGGSGELSTYDRGDVWAFADLLGQTLDQI